MHGRILAALMGMVTLAAGCKDSAGPAPPVYDVVLRSGDDQQGPAGSELGDPLQVTVTSPANDPVRGVTVRFRVVAGTGASLSDTIVTSGFDGVARVTARLGPTVGEYEFIGFIPRKEDQAVRFSATATPPPTLASVTPTTFGPGDTISVAGGPFNSSLSGNAVYIGGSRARIISGTGDTELRVVVPACVTPGTVAVRVQVGSASTNVINATYSSATPIIELRELEGITVSGTEVDRCLKLPGGGARYLLVPNFASASGSPSSTSFFLGSTATAPPPAEPVGDAPRTSLQSELDRSLRLAERRMRDDAPVGARAIAEEIRPLEALTLGSRRNFRVLGALDGSSFKTSTAELVHIGQNILLYLDVNSPSGGFTTGEVRALGVLFDATLYEIGVRNFGSESDIDANGRVIVLLTPLINALTPSAECATRGFVTGYFYGYDLTYRDMNSNKGEVFYALVPDPAGTRSCSHTTDQVKRIVPATFIHEFQHMISFNQHFLVRRGSDEDLWLNEALSHIAEEQASRYYEAKCPPPSCRTDPTQLFPDSSQGFINGQLVNSYNYLENTKAVSVTTFSEFGSLEERGAAWLFLRWLGDLKDSTIYARLVQSSKTGIANVESRTGETFASLFGDFAIALYTDSVPGVPRTSIPARYRFQSRNLREIYARLSARNPTLFPNPYPFTPATLPANGSVTGSMLQGTMAHYEMRTPITSSQVALQFAPSSAGGQFPASLQAQLGVFRLTP